MKVKAIKTEWFQDYKLPSMFIAANQCDWKCDTECGDRVCQNSTLASSTSIDIDIENTIQRYINNPITSAIIFGGLEPMLQFDDIIKFIKTLRTDFCSDDFVIIYTGYNKNEISSQINELKQFKNIVVKFGRFIPNQEKHYDDVLGVYLASPNQYAEVIS